MQVITYKGRPVTIRKMHELEGVTPSYAEVDADLDGYIAAPSATKARRAYVSWFGFTWGERVRGIEVTPFFKEILWP